MPENNTPEMPREPQRLDAWAFLLLNLRGRRPPWLDRVMLGFTQLGNGVVGLAIALIFLRAASVCYMLTGLG